MWGSWWMPRDLSHSAQIQKWQASFTTIESQAQTALLKREDNLHAVTLGHAQYHTHIRCDNETTLTSSSMLLLDSTRVSRDGRNWSRQSPIRLWRRGKKRKNEICLATVEKGINFVSFLQPPQQRYAKSPPCFVFHEKSWQNKIKHREKFKIF